MRQPGTALSGSLLLLSLFLQTAAVATAQTTGEIQGTIADAGGSPLAGVTVEAASPSLQGTRSAVTRGDGRYRFPGLPPGVYRVKATLSGFGPSEKTVTVSLDATATVDIALELVAREEVVVPGSTPLVDVTSTTGGTNYTSQLISRLPVARNYADIVRANPGVVEDQGDTQGRSLALSIYGATSAEQLWIIDGINTTNVIRGFQGKAINNEFVQEVEVKTGGYQAEYGRALGGVINVITKSGGNQFHGEAFVYYDSLPWKARPRVTDQDETDVSLSGTGNMRVSDYTRTDFGADLGGFLLKDRLWFFAAYDRVELPGKISRITSSPLVPNTLQFPLDATDNLYSGKLTWNVATGTSLVATAFADPTTNSGAGGADPRQGQFVLRSITNPDPATWEFNRFIGGTDYALRGNQLFGSTALLTLQGARHQDRYELIPTDAGEQVRLTDATCQGGTPTSPCRPTFNFVTGGLGALFGPIYRNASLRDQYRADLALYSGGHEIKLGGDYQFAKTDSITHLTGFQMVARLNERGQIYYQHFFIAKSPTDLTPTDNRRRSRTGELGAYVQDSWKAAAGLTISAGLRWDEEDIRNFQDVSVIKTIAAWQPRLGVIWDPMKDGRTKLYAFAGRFYYSLPTDIAIRAYGGQSRAFTYNFDPVSVVQDPTVLGHGKSSFNGSVVGDPVDKGLKGIYQDEYTVGLERLLSPTLSLGVKATYRKLGNAIEDRCDLDYTRPETTFSSCAIVNPGSNGQFARGDIPGCNGLDDVFRECSETIPPVPAAHRIYRGIELTGRKSLSERAWLQASYVYSSLRGNYDGEVSESYYGQTDPGNSSDFDYPQQAHNSYGRLFLDRPHSFRLDGFYTAPFKLSIGLQAFLRSGAPLNRVAYFNSNEGPVIQLVPRGYAGRMPYNWEANLTLAYPVDVGPLTATVQLYVFNLFNNQIATTRDTVWTTAWEPPPGYPATLFDPNQPQTNPDYGKVTSRQEPRLLRAAVHISF
jgi:hypothetical protein